MKGSTKTVKRPSRASARFPEAGHSRFLYRFSVPGKVGVPGSIERIPDLHIRLWIQGPAVGEPFHQVGIADDRPTEGDHVRMAALNCCFSRFPCVAAVPDKKTAWGILLKLSRHWKWFFHATNQPAGIPFDFKILAQLGVLTSAPCALTLMDEMLCG